MSKADVLSTAFAAERDIEFAEIDEINIRDHGDFATVAAAPASAASSPVRM